MKSKKNNAPNKIKEQMYEINVKYFFIIKLYPNPPSGNRHQDIQSGPNRRENPTRWVETW